LGGGGAGISGRIKDFEVLEVQADTPSRQTILLVVTACSDGAIRLWSVGGKLTDLEAGRREPQQIGSLMGTLETGNRITCLGAFILDGRVDERSLSDEEAETEGDKDD
ncbi:Protein mak11, partial [Teratosphaeriaceae sp. CCFEE 6253]